MLTSPREGEKINLQSAGDFTPQSPTPRAVGTLNLSSKRGVHGSAIDELRQSGSLRMLFPHGSGLTAMILNTAGGVTGGDRLSIAARAGEASALTITTQAAERAYRAIGDEAGKISTDLKVETGGSLHWLPQELILFDGANLKRRLTVDLAQDATFLMVEPIVFGRLAMNETLDSLVFDDQITIRRDGKPIYIDGLRFRGDVNEELALPGVGNGAGAVASVVFVSPKAERFLDTVRAQLPQTAGASLLANDILSLRFLAADSFLLRKSLVPALELLRGASLPTSWRL